MSLVLDTLVRRARRQPNDIVVTDGLAPLSCLDLWLEVVKLSTKLVLLEIGPGPIAFCLENSPRWVVLDLALTKLGRLSVPLPVAFTEAQRHQALTQAGAVLLITEQPSPNDAGCERIMLLGRALYLQARDAVPVALPADTAKIIFSLGTTDQPKGVCLSQAELERVALSLVEAIGKDYAGTHRAVPPLAILLENVAGLYPTLLAGGCYHVPPPASFGLARPSAPDFDMLAGALAENAAPSTILNPELLRGLLTALTDQGIGLPTMFVLLADAFRSIPPRSDEAYVA
ncbi:MAG: AMP-dependent synthetase [Rhodospirillales bacterium]|nr:AMP-dependent synthetase [Rhodospirillales bacterium]